MFVKKILSLLPALFLFFTFMLAPIEVSAQISDPFCDTVDGAKNTEFCDTKNQSNGGTSSNNAFVGPNGILNTVVDVITVIVGIASVIVIVVSAILFAVSGGDPQKVAKARSSMIYAVVGLVVSTLSRQIIVFILSRI